MPRRGCSKSRQWHHGELRQSGGVCERQLMTIPLGSYIHVYAGSPLDRADTLRDNPDWVAARFDDSASRFLPIWRGRCLVSAEPHMAARLTKSVLEAECSGGACVLLGLQDGLAVFAVDVSALDTPRWLEQGAAFKNLREIVHVLPASEAALLAHARAMIHWRMRHGFCPVCGAGTLPQRAGAVLVCQGCGAHHFPRTDAAVIMAITFQDYILLGRATRFPPTMFSVLAGFVEPGESLEETVAREVYEEVGLRIRDVTYHSSQPWPFPSSLMVGFTATAESNITTINPAEIVEARWFDRASLASPDLHRFQLPPASSIARRLIEDWRLS